MATTGHGRPGQCCPCKRSCGAGSPEHEDKIKERRSKFGPGPSTVLPNHTGWAFIYFTAFSEHRSPGWRTHAFVLYSGPDDPRHGSKAGALAYNFLSALTFLLGGLVVYAASAWIDVSFLLPFATGSFLYIGTADLIPEIKKAGDPRTNLVHFAALAAGLVVFLVIRIWFPHEH